MADKFTTSMYEMSTMETNAELLRSMGFTVTIGSEVLSVSKSTTKGTSTPRSSRTGKKRLSERLGGHTDWITFQNFKTVAEFNCFCNLFFELACSDGSDHLLEHIRELRKKGYERY